MPHYTVQYALSGSPETTQTLEFDAQDSEGVFSKLERMPGLTGAVLWEESQRLGKVRRNPAGMWEVM